MNAVVVVMVSLLSISACWTDVRRMRIPNELTYSFALGGIVYQFAVHGFQGLGSSASGVAAGMLPLYVLFLMKGIGGGDVKWFGAFGAWMGPQPTFQLLVYSILFAGIIATFLLLLRIEIRRKIRERLATRWLARYARTGVGSRFPFMLAVAPGFMLLMGKG